MRSRTIESFRVMSFTFQSSSHGEKKRRNKNFVVNSRLTHGNRNCIELNVFGDTAILIDSTHREKKYLRFYFYMEISHNQVDCSFSSSSCCCFAFKPWSNLSRNQQKNIQQFSGINLFISLFSRKE